MFWGVGVGEWVSPSSHVLQCGLTQDDIESLLPNAYSDEDNEHALYSIRTWVHPRSTLPTQIGSNASGCSF